MNSTWKEDFLTQPHIHFLIFFIFSCLSIIQIIFFDFNKIFLIVIVGCSTLCYTKWSQCKKESNSKDFNEALKSSFGVFIHPKYTKIFADNLIKQTNRVGDPLKITITSFNSYRAPYSLFPISFFYFVLFWEIKHSNSTKRI